MTTLMFKFPTCQCRGTTNRICHNAVRRDALVEVKKLKEVLSTVCPSKVELRSSGNKHKLMNACPKRQVEIFKDHKWKS